MGRLDLPTRTGMREKIPFAIALLLLASSAFVFLPAVPAAAAQVTVQPFLAQFGSQGYDALEGLAADETGIYVVGTTTDAIGEGSNFGLNDAFVSKYALDRGTLVWARQFGSVAQDWASSVAAGGSSGIYVAGATYGSLGGNSAGDYDVFLARLGPDGSAPSSPPKLSISSKDAHGNLLPGYRTILSQNGSTVTQGFTPFLANVMQGQDYQARVLKYGNYTFDHWEDDGSTSSERAINLSSEDEHLVAVYRNIYEQVPGRSLIVVESTDLNGNTIRGYHAALFSDDDMPLATSYTPASFVADNDRTYRVSVAEGYGKYTFDRWEGTDSGSHARTNIVQTGDESVEALVAAYRATGP